MPLIHLEAAKSLDYIGYRLLAPPFELRQSAVGPCPCSTCWESSPGAIRLLALTIALRLRHLAPVPQNAAP